jgi:hypothetical protein
MRNLAKNFAEHLVLWYTQRPHRFAPEGTPCDSNNNDKLWQRRLIQAISLILATLGWATSTPSGQQFILQHFAGTHLLLTSLALPHAVGITLLIFGIVNFIVPTLYKLLLPGMLNNRRAALDEANQSGANGRVESDIKLLTPNNIAANTTEVILNFRGTNGRVSDPSALTAAINHAHMENRRMIYSATDRSGPKVDGSNVPQLMNEALIELKTLNLNDRIKNGELALKLTGHSRGAVMALAMAAYVHQIWPKAKIQVVAVDPVKGPMEEKLNQSFDYESQGESHKDITISKLLDSLNRNNTYHPLTNPLADPENKKIKATVLVAATETRSHMKLTLPTGLANSGRIVKYRGHHSSILGMTGSTDGVGAEPWYPRDLDIPYIGPILKWIFLNPCRFILDKTIDAWNKGHDYAEIGLILYSELFLNGNAQHVELEGFAEKFAPQAVSANQAVPANHLTSSMGHPFQFHMLTPATGTIVDPERKTGEPADAIFSELAITKNAGA